MKRHEVDLVAASDTSNLTKAWIATHKDMPHLKVSGGSEFDAMSKARHLMGSGFMENDWLCEEVEVHKPSLTTLEVNLKTTTNKKEEGNPKMTNKHKLYDMIVAKAANMELVRLAKPNNGKWVVQADVVQKSTQFGEGFEYFLCLPQHKEACLHWLNGCYVQERGFYNADAFGDITMIGNNCWNVNHIFMDSTSEFRIKPKKVKRFIASFPWGGNDDFVTPKSFPTTRELNEYVDTHYGEQNSMQIHEIEVEL